MRPLWLCLLTVTACGPSSVVADEPLTLADGGVRPCLATSDRVGWVADLVTRHHLVSGRVTMTDACTLTVTDFTYDGQGLDVRFTGAGASTPFGMGTALGPQLLRPGGRYQSERLTIRLPDATKLTGPTISAAKTKRCALSYPLVRYGGLSSFAE